MGASVRDRFAYYAFRVVIVLMRPVPLRAAYWIASNVAVLCYHFVFPRQRKAQNANLARVLAPASAGVSTDARYVDSVARQSFRNFGKYVIDVIHYPVMEAKEVRRRLRFEQWDELEAMRDSGRGVVIATLHFGNWDLGAAALAAYGLPINAIAERFAYEPMNDLVQSSRGRLGMRVVPHDRVGTSVLRLLKRGEFLATLIDVADDRSVVQVEFFGAPARLSAAPARIALRTGAWVMPAVVLRGPGDDLEIRPIIDSGLRDFHPSGDEEADVRALTRGIVRALEPHIRAYPEQWFIMRHIWRPSAEPLPGGAGV